MIASTMARSVGRQQGKLAVACSSVSTLSAVMFIGSSRCAQPPGEKSMPTVKITRAEAEAYVKGFDFSKIDALSDDDIARQVADNPDAAPLLREGEDYSKWTK